MPTLEEIQNDAYRRRRISTPIVKKLLRSRWLIWSLIVVNLAVFLLVIITGIFGVQTGNQNLSIVFIWILWWFALIAILVPFASRAWCGMCPLPSLGEWLERRSIISVKGKSYGLNKKWPKKLKNLWLVNSFFLGIALFSPFVTTHPMVTGVLMLSLLIMPIFLHFVFEKRVFCKYVCPVGGFLGLYSNFSCLELRVEDREVCYRHKTKECIRGSSDESPTPGYGCPWFEFPQNLKRNSYCGLCMECVRTCPKDNTNIYLRPFAVDLIRDTKEKDTSEAWKSLIMLNLAMMYSLVLLGPYGDLKDWATFADGVPMFAFYSLIFLGTSLVFLPALFLLFVLLSRWLAKARDIAVKRLFIDYSMALVPIGLMGWIAFSIALIQVNWSYILNVASDPFGWGWNLLGTKDVAWVPLVPELLPIIQIATLMVGVIFSIYVADKVSRKHFKETGRTVWAQIPIVAFVVIVTMVFLR
ncbi:MAG: 4Fe-4S binding protein, partial [Thermoplasmata archaeon]